MTRTAWPEGVCDRVFELLEELREDATVPAEWREAADELAVDILNAAALPATPPPPCPHLDGGWCDACLVRRYAHENARLSEELASARALPVTPEAPRPGPTSDAEGVWPVLRKWQKGETYQIVPNDHDLLGGGLTEDEAGAVTRAVRRAYYATMPAHALPGAAPASPAPQGEPRDRCRVCRRQVMPQDFAPGEDVVCLECSQAAAAPQGEPITPERPGDPGSASSGPGAAPSGGPAPHAEAPAKPRPPSLPEPIRWPADPDDP